MKLYYSRAACSLAPHIVLHELGGKFEAVNVDLRTKKSAGGDFLMVNPKGYVPTLELDNGEILTEVSAILQYLADQNPDAKLIPKAGTFERYRCVEWLNFIATEIHKGFGPLWKEQTPEDYRTLVREILFGRFDYLASRLNNSSHLMGEPYTVADAYLYTVLSWSKYLKVDLSRWPSLMGYLERVGSRPAVRAALKAEGLLK